MIASLMVDRRSRRPTDATFRANSSSEVTNLFCRLPLPTLFYWPEAVHLGDLMRLWVRAGERFKSFPRIFTDRAQCTGHHKGAMLYAAVVPLSGRTTSRELATKLGREPQPGLYSTSASSFALPRSTPLPAGLSPQPGAGILACFPFGTLDRAQKHTIHQ